MISSKARSMRYREERMTAGCLESSRFIVPLAELAYGEEKETK